MRLVNIQIWCFTLLATFANPWSMPTWIHAAGLDRYFPESSYQLKLCAAASAVLAVWSMLTTIFISRRQATIGQLFAVNVGYVLFCFCCGLLFMLAVNPIGAGHAQWLRIGLPLGNLLLLAKGFQLGAIRGDASVWKRRIWTAGFGAMAILLLLEAAFMWVAKSQTNDNALASKVWFARYWRLEADGLRVEKQDQAARIGVFGDSFTAGHGIKDVQDRFSANISLEGGDGPAIPARNYGANGASTRDELHFFKEQSTTPPIILLCWYVNDIDDIAKAAGLRTGNEGLQMPPPISLAHGSYLFNYLFNLFPDPLPGQNYMRFLHQAYASELVLKHYFEVCDAWRAECKARNLRLGIVLFPMLNAVHESEFALAPVRSYWQQYGPVVDLSTVYAAYPAQELVVNGSDAHPSKLAHRIAGHAIASMLIDAQWWP